MKITQDIRAYAEGRGITPEEALKQKLEEKGREFVEKGSGIYVKTHA